MRDVLSLNVLIGDDGYVARFNPVLQKLVNLDEVQVVSEKVEGAVSFFVKSSEFFVPLTSNINVEEELEKLDAELKYTEGFLAGVMKKLGNERFVAGAPDNVVAMEQQKRADAEAKIAALKESMARLKV
jgi:valyl-tRNA synthetase